LVLVTCVRYNKPIKQASTIKMIVLLIGPKLWARPANDTVFWLRLPRLRRLIATELEYVIVFVFLGGSARTHISLAPPIYPFKVGLKNFNPDFICSGLVLDLN
jgi:hypothetical protein